MSGFSYGVAAPPPRFCVIDPQGRFGVQPKNCPGAYNLRRSASYRFSTFAERIS